MLKVNNFLIYHLVYQVYRFKVRTYDINVVLTTVITDLKLRFRITRDLKDRNKTF